MTTENYQEQFDRFRGDVSKHIVTVLRDDGLYRHLRCSAGTFNQQFDVVTWPGSLCYVGDMGCFVFQRLEDMFEFFRGRRTATIDRDYLAEKAVASDKHDGIRAYSEALFRAAIKEDYDAFVERREIGGEFAVELWDAIEDDVLSRADNHHDAVAAATAFQWELQEVFPGFWERRLEEFTGRFRWCCYAIPWAIEQYDAIERPTATESRP